MKLKQILIFSADDWSSPLKYQRHHLAEFLSKQEDVEHVYFLSKAAIRKIEPKDIFKMIFSRFFGKNNKCERLRNEKIAFVSYRLFPYQSKILNSIFQKKFWTMLRALNLNPKDTVIISYQPFPELLQLVRTLKPFKFIYISVHDYENMAGVCSAVKLTEQNIIKKADLFTTDSSSLYEKLSGKQLSERSLTLAPACPLSVVRMSKSEIYNKSQINNLIYFGTVAKYLDWDFLRGIVAKGFNIDFLGYEYDLKLSEKLPLSKLYKPIDFENAYKIFTRYDAVILPYMNNIRNQHVIPAKIYECFSLGLPIFTPDMLWTRDEEIKNYVITYENIEDFIEKAVNFDFPGFDVQRNKMLELAEKNSWENRFAPLIQFLRAEQ